MSQEQFNSLLIEIRRIVKEEAAQALNEADAELLDEDPEEEIEE